MTQPLISKLQHNLYSIIRQSYNPKKQDSHLYFYIWLLFSISLSPAWAKAMVWRSGGVLIQINKYLGMSRNRSRKGRTHQRPVFITKLFEMVEDSSIQAVFSWTATGDSFNIKSVTKFTEEVLPKYFKHKNFSSFVRQLNMYGFHKIRHEDGENVYMNEHFKMGGKHQLRNISRRIKDIKEEKEQAVAVYNGVGREKTEQKQLNELKNNQKNLEEMLKTLMRENQRLTEEHQTLTLKYEYGLRVKETRMEEFLLMLLSRRSNANLTNGAEQILQIRNGQQEAENQLKSPIDRASHNLQQSEHYPKVRRIMDYIYGRMNRQRQANNQGDNESINQAVSEMSFAIRSEINEGSLNIAKGDDDGFLSVNSFLDIQEFEDHIDLEESN